MLISSLCSEDCVDMVLGHGCTLKNAQPPKFQLRLQFMTNGSPYPAVWDSLKAYFRPVKNDHDTIKIIVLNNNRQVYRACYTSSQMTTDTIDDIFPEDLDSSWSLQACGCDESAGSSDACDESRAVDFSQCTVTNSSNTKVRIDHSNTSQTLEALADCAPQPITSINVTENFNHDSGCLSQDGDKNKPANSASAIRKRREKEYTNAARCNLDKAEDVFKNFPDIKLGEKKAHVKSYFDKGPVKFALLILAENSKFRDFKDKALSVVTKTAESALRAVDGNGMFTKDDIEAIIVALRTFGISKDAQDKIRCRINEWKKKLKQADNAYTRRPQDFDMDKVLDDIANLTDNLDEIIYVYKDTVPARLHWIKKEKVTVADALQNFPHYKSYCKLLVDIDFSHLTKRKSPQITSIGDFFRDQQRALISLALDNQLITLAESKTFATNVVALLTLPRLIEYYGKKSSNAKCCNIFIPKPEETDLESAKSAVRHNGVNHSFITCATVNAKLAFAIIGGDAFDALDVFIKLHYSFEVKPSDDYKFLYEFLKAIMFDKKKPMHMKFLSNLKISNEMLRAKQPRPGELKPPKSQSLHASVSEPAQSQPLRSRFIINPVKGKHPLLYSNPNAALLQQKCNDVDFDWKCSYQVPMEPKVLQDYKTITTLDVASDGHCGFSSVSLLLSGVPTNYMALREVVGNAIINGTFEKAKEFYEFSFPGSSMAERKKALTVKAVGKMYAEDARNPETWWDATDSLTLALHLQMNIVVYDDNQRVWTVYNETTMPNPSEAKILEHLPTILLFLKNDHYMPIIDVE
uniref:OTU domain-containing protein n=1 Tax=Panagrellus redivivus TaxID=6233 RepID=A0A7E4W0Y1_PANRE